MRLLLPLLLAAALPLAAQAQSGSAKTEQAPRRRVAPPDGPWRCPRKAVERTLQTLQIINAAERWL
jgi:hypothetical protein